MTLGRLDPLGRGVEQLVGEVRERPRGREILPMSGTLGSLDARLAWPNPWKRWLASSSTASARVRLPSSVNVTLTCQVWSGMGRPFVDGWLLTACRVAGAGGRARGLQTGAVDGAAVRV